MKITAALVSLAIAAFGVVKAQEDGPSDTTILNYALTLEYLERDFYAGALKKFSKKDFTRAGFPAYVYDRVRVLASQEANHASFLAGALGDAATMPCKYNFPYNTPAEFLALSRVLEGVGVSAYLGAAADIDSDAYLTAAGSILTVEARHQAVISEIQGALGFPSPYDTPLDYSQVYSLAAPFIVSCPPSNPALPVTRFPALTVGTPNVRTKLTFECNVGSTPLYAHFLNGLTDTVVKIKHDHTVSFPRNLTGTVYVVISTSSESGALNDQNTIAGPGIVQLPSKGDRMVPMPKPDKKHDDKKHDDKKHH